MSCSVGIGKSFVLRAVEASLRKKRSDFQVVYICNDDVSAIYGSNRVGLEVKRIAQEAKEEAVANQQPCVLLYDNRGSADLLADGGEWLIFSLRNELNSKGTLAALSLCGLLHRPDHGTAPTNIDALFQLLDAHAPELDSAWQQYQSVVTKLQQKVVCLAITEVHI